MTSSMPSAPPGEALGYQPPKLWHGAAYYARSPYTGPAPDFLLKNHQETNTGLQMPKRTRLTREDLPRPPIDQKTCFDVIVSCGFGAKSYWLAERFAYPAFRVGFARKIFCVLLAQVLVCDFWMALVLTSPAVRTLYADQNAVTYAGIMAYGLIYALIRWSSCGGDGMCFMGYLMITIVMTLALSIACGGLATLFPYLFFVGCALWVALLALIIAQFCACANILTHVAYAIGALSAVLGATMSILWLLQFSGQTQIVAVDWPNIVIVIFTSCFLALAIVYEVKKIIGGRRADLDEHQWVLAAIIL